MATLHEMSVKPNRMEAVEKWLADGVFGKALAAQPSGLNQVVMILGAQNVIAKVAGPSPFVGSFEIFVRDLQTKAERYGSGMFVLTDRQREWAVNELQDRYNRAIGK